MPYGVYTAGTAGEEVSSTYEGRHLTFTESQLTHPSHTDGFVDKGDAVLCGKNIVGVAFQSAAAAADLIAIDTEGIWQLSVVAENEDGNVAVAVGDEIFINMTTCILSKIANKNTHQRFGYALYAIGSGETDVIPVKVHWNPDDATEKVGTHAVPEASAHADKIFREYRYRSTSTTGDIRGQYMELLMNGIGQSGEACRNRTMIEAAVAVAHGCHDGVEFAAGGSVTGLAVGHRATYMGKNAAAAATIAGGMSELYAAGASTNFAAATMHSIHRFVVDGNATGRATAENAFEFANIPSGTDAADMLKTDMHTATPTDGLRIIINGAVYHICLVSA